MLLEASKSFTAELLKAQLMIINKHFWAKVLQI